MHLLELAQDPLHILFLDDAIGMSLLLHARADHLGGCFHQHQRRGGRHVHDLAVEPAGHHLAVRIFPLAAEAVVERRIDRVAVVPVDQQVAVVVEKFEVVVDHVTRVLLEQFWRHAADIFGFLLRLFRVTFQEWHDEMVMHHVCAELAAPHVFFEPGSRLLNESGFAHILTTDDDEVHGLFSFGPASQRARSSANGRMM